MTLNKRILAVLAISGFISGSAYAESCSLATLKTDKAITANFVVAKDSDGGLKLTSKSGDAMSILTGYAKTNKCELFVVSGSDMVKGLNLKTGQDAKSADANQILLITEKKLKEVNMVNLNLGAKKINADGTIVSAQAPKKAK